MNNPSSWRATTQQHLRRRWEELFFLTVFSLLCFQVFAFVNDTHSIPSLRGGAIGAFASFEFFVARYITFISPPLVVAPLLYLAIRPTTPDWARKYIDVVGIYIAARMIIQLMGLNLLVFDKVTPRFTLITQLLIFLPYSLLVWGWIYWRLDSGARKSGRQCFRLDCESDPPRPIDYGVASFSSVFSASISAIKGRTARSRILILMHGFFIYDVMGLTLSRAIALVQTN